MRNEGLTNNQRAAVIVMLCVLAVAAFVLFLSFSKARQETQFRERTVTIGTLRDMPERSSIYYDIVWI